VYANLGNEHFTALSVATNHVVNADQLPPADDAIGDGRAA
jgi:hypothetical protein